MIANIMMGKYFTDKFALIDKYVGDIEAKTGTIIVLLALIAIVCLRVNEYTLFKESAEMDGKTVINSDALHDLYPLYFGKFVSVPDLQKDHLAAFD